MICSSYLDLALAKKQRKALLRNCVKLLRKSAVEFDAIAFRGMSGALIAPPVADLLGKHLIMVRKPGDQRHSSRLVEGEDAITRYIIIDDFIRTGDTVRQVVKAVWENHTKDAECVGVLVYNEDDMRRNIDSIGCNDPIPVGCAKTGRDFGSATEWWR